MIEIPKKKAQEKARVEIRIPVDLKDLLLKKTDEEGYDYFSDFIRDIIIDKIKGKKTAVTPGVTFDFDDSRIITEIQQNRTILIQVLHNQKTAVKEQSIETIVENLIQVVSLDQMKKCKTVEELRDLFPLEAQQTYIYDLLNHLEKMKLVISKEEKGQENLYWLED